PAGLGVFLEELIDLAVKRGRADRVGQQRDAGPFAIADPLAQDRDQVAPRLRLLAEADGLRALRVVEAEDRRLMNRRGAAETGGVEGVALDLGRPALVALDE